MVLQNQFFYKLTIFPLILCYTIVFSTVISLFLYSNTYIICTCKLFIWWIFIWYNKLYIRGIYDVKTPQNLNVHNKE